MKHDVTRFGSTELITVEIQWWVLMQSIILMILDGNSTVQYRCSLFWTVILPFFVPSKQIGKHQNRKFQMSQHFSWSHSFQVLISILCPNYDNVMTNCIYIQTFDIFSHRVAFSSPGIGYRAAVFPACKICAFNQWKALVLFGKCKMFFHYLFKIHFISFYI